MKVLMLGWELPPHNSGGLGQACYDLCKSLAKKKVDIEFILPYHADHKIDFMKVSSATQISPEVLQYFQNVYESHKFSFEDRQLEIAGMDQYQWYEKAVLHMSSSREFDIVHAHDWLTFRAALRLKERWGCPIILHVHSVESDRAGGKPGNPLVREIEESALYLADRVIAISKHNKQAIMRDYGIPDEAIEVVHNSMNVEDLAPLDEDNDYRYLEFMKSQGYRVVSNVGRITIQKGHHNLLLALQKVVAKVPKTLALIVGSGELESELMELAASLGIGANVIFTDFQRGKRLRDAFAAGDLFVLPSISEPFGLTPLESIGWGTPALISKQSGVSEVLVNALKVDFWDVDEMANQIAAVMMNDALRDELQRNSRWELDKLSWDNTTDKLVNIYGQHLAGAIL